jgi:hypothetical protein
LANLKEISTKDSLNTSIAYATSKEMKVILKLANTSIQAYTT